ASPPPRCPRSSPTRRSSDLFFRLGRLYVERNAKGRAMTSEAASRISDLQFTRAYRVPFQYSRLVQEYLGTSAFVESSAGVTVTRSEEHTSELQSPYDLVCRL